MKKQTNTLRYENIEGTIRSSRDTINNISVDLWSLLPDALYLDSQRRLPSQIYNRVKLNTYDGCLLALVGDM